MSTSDGAVGNTTRIIDNGPATRRWNLVIVSEGYQAGEMPQFALDAQNLVTALFATPPFSEPAGSGHLFDAINVFQIDVTSTDSGADDPTDCGGTGATPATYFDAEFCGYGVPRLLLVNESSVLSVVNARVPKRHAIVVLVNSTIFGGSGGSVAVASRHPQSLQIALHELGHSPFGLADEYEYYEGCGIDFGQDRHSATEPSEPNVTTKRTRATIKWRNLIAGATAVLTTTNLNCTVCDPRTISPVAVGVVGAFEGAHYCHCDAFRPEFNCRMRDLTFDFCAVCQQRIRNTLQPHLP
jgi:hypothetical protein